MKCNNCGTINEEGIFFCCKCGESLKAQTAGQPQAEMKTCSSCGKQSPKTSSYCGYCGAKLPEEEDPENESSGPAPIYTLSMVDKYVGDIFIGISRSSGVLKVFNDRVEYHIKRSNMFGNALGKIGNTKKTESLSEMVETYKYSDIQNCFVSNYVNNKSGVLFVMKNGIRFKFVCVVESCDTLKVIRTINGFIDAEAKETSYRYFSSQGIQPVMPAYQQESLSQPAPADDPMPDTEPVHPAGYPQQVQNTQPMGYPQPAQNAQPMGYPQPVQNTQPMGYPQTAQNAQPMGYPQTAQDTQPMGYPQPAQDTQPMGYPQPAQNTQLMGYPQPAQDAQPMGYPQPAQGTQQMGYPQPAQGTQQMGYPQIEQNAQPMGYPQTVQNAQPMGYSQIEQNAQPMGYPQTAQNTQPMGYPQQVQNTQPMGYPQTAQNAQPMGYPQQYQQPAYPQNVPDAADKYSMYSFVMELSNFIRVDEQYIAVIGAVRKGSVTNGAVLNVISKLGLNKGSFEVRSIAVNKVISDIACEGSEDTALLCSFSPSLLKAGDIVCE